MKIKYLCTYWGCENLSPKEFLAKVISEGYTGVEINLPADKNFINEFSSELNKIRETVIPDFIFIAQQVLDHKIETADGYLKRIVDRLDFLFSLRPDAINSHTGKDFFEFNDNCRIIEITEQMSKKYNIPVLHEIHRGRFSFHLKTLFDYIGVFPDLKLIADFSHFCTVSESLLFDQADDLRKLYPNIHHIHARVGSSQSPQVNHPFAPEWKENLDLFVSWWQNIIDLNKNKGYFTITPEFGPFPYMPQEPFTQNPLSNQWEVNIEMKNYLQKKLFY